MHLYVLPTLVRLEDDGVKKVLVFFDLGLISPEHSCKTKVPYFKYTIKPTHSPKNVTTLAWRSARMFNGKDFYTFTLSKFVYGIRFEDIIATNPVEERQNGWNFFAGTKKFHPPFNPVVSHNFRMYFLNPLEPDKTSKM